MSATTVTTDTIERLDKQRNRLLAWFISTFFLWILCSIVFTTIYVVSSDLSNDALGRLSMYLVGLPTILWLIILIRYRDVRRKITSDPERFLGYVDSDGGIRSRLAYQ